MKMQPFENIKEYADDIRFILFDVDDTVTLDGKLTEDAYSAMWRLYRAGYRLIPVTGRPAGWCQMMLRQWPVEAVVCENGAFALTREGDGPLRMMLHPNAAKDPWPALEKLRDAVLAAVPGARVAGDQFSRLYDVAFDFCEDEPKLPMEAVDRIMEVCREMGAKYKLSTIHVNAWYGEYDKLSMAKRLINSLDPEGDEVKTVLFFGDSPNDEPMFEYFKNSCGVENVRDFESRMEHLPTYIAKGMGGAGFAHAAQQLIALAKRD